MFQSVKMSGSIVEPRGHITTARREVHRADAERFLILIRKVLENRHRREVCQPHGILFRVGKY